MDGIDVVFHCAALKHVESGEYNPFEATQTNVVGTQNVIDACLATGVGTMILTSSDKAANPTSVMGASQAPRREAGQRRDELPWLAPDAVRQRPVRQRARLARLRARAVLPADRGRRPGDRHGPGDDPVRDVDRPRGRAGDPGGGDRPRRRGLRLQDAGGPPRGPGPAAIEVVAPTTRPRPVRDRDAHDRPATRARRPTRS